VRLEYQQRLEKKAFKMSIVLMLRDLDHHDRAELIDKLVEGNFNIPHSQKSTLSRSVIYQWLREYTKDPGDFEVLLPKERKDRNTFRRISEEQKKALVRWRSENAARSASELRDELLAHAITSQDPVPSAATIARFLRSVNLDRKTMRQGIPVKVRLPYQAPYPQRIWLADTKGPNLKLRDSRNPGEVKIAKPILIEDDHSRFFPAAFYVFEENERVLMELFKKAVWAYGVPDIFYVDRGSPYMGNSLKQAATLLGCRIIHTAPRDAAAKGKVEKSMQYIYDKLETELLLKQPPPFLEEANEYLAALICQEYHRRVHSSTGQTPEERFFSFPPEYRRFVSEKALSMIFLPYARSKVSKTGLIHLNKLQYLVPDAKLYRKWVQVRYDPADLSRVHVWHDDHYYGVAEMYLEDNDYLKREQLIKQLGQIQQPVIPEVWEVPRYSHLERTLAAHRAEFTEVNEELSRAKAQRSAVKATLTETSATTEVSCPEFGPDTFTHLLAVLLKTSLDAHQRLSILTTWRTYGPFTEAMVRRTVGELLGQGHPVTDISGYLDALRLAAHFKKED
jgi:transposase InsO family protein